MRALDHFKKLTQAIEQLFAFSSVTSLSTKILDAAYKAYWLGSF